MATNVRFLVVDFFESTNATLLAILIAVLIIILTTGCNDFFSVDWDHHVFRVFFLCQALLSPMTCCETENFEFFCYYGVNEFCCCCCCFLFFFFGAEIPPYLFSLASLGHSTNIFYFSFGLSYFNFFQYCFINLVEVTCEVAASSWLDWQTQEKHCYSVG